MLKKFLVMIFVIAISGIAANAAKNETTQKESKHGYTYERFLKLSRFGR